MQRNFLKEAQRDRKAEITWTVYTNGILYHQPEDPQPPLLIHFCECANNQRQRNSLLYIESCDTVHRHVVTFSEEALHSCLYWQSMSNQTNNLKNYSDPAGKDWTSCPTAASLFSFVICTANHCRDAWNLASGEGICSCLTENEQGQTLCCLTWLSLGPSFVCSAHVHGPNVQLLHRYDADGQIRIFLMVKLMCMSNPSSYHHLKSLCCWLSLV